MLVVTVPVLAAETSILDALGKSSPEGVLVARGVEIRLAKPSQIRRIERQGGSRTLLDLWTDTEAVHRVTDEEAARNAIGTMRSKGGGLSGDPFTLVKGRRLATVSLGGLNYLISESEDYLVDYYCQLNLHTWSPPPQFVEGQTFCWCNSVVVRN